MRTCHKPQNFLRIILKERRQYICYFTIGNSLQAETLGLQRLKISADLDILPIPGGLVCVTGAVSRFPAVEAYYDHNNTIGEEFALRQSDYGVYALAAPDRDLPPCLSREMP